jgi:hypothetical protein
MATISLNIQTIDQDGLVNPSSQTVILTNDADFVNDGKVFVRIGWTATPGTLTIFAQGTVGANPPLDIADQTRAMPTNDDIFIGPFPPGLYNDANGKVLIDGDQQFTATAFRLDT